MKRWLNWYAIFLAIHAFVVVVSGAWETSLRAAPGAANATIASMHLTLGVDLGVLLVGLSVWLMVSGFVALGGITLVAVLADCGLGMVTAPVTHAVLAQILVALSIAAAVSTSTAWQRGPDLVFDAGWPSLRSLAVITPVFVFAQVILGAAFRHRVTGLTWHIVGAMVVSLLVLLLGMFVMQQFPKHPALRPAAIALLTMALVQVLLGIGAITAEMMAPDNVVPASVMLFTAAHVAGGSLTLAATLVLSIQIRRNVQKPAEEPEEDESPAKA